MYQHFGTTQLIHDTMIQEELQRNAPDRHHYFGETQAVRGPVPMLRQLAARALYGLSARIAPVKPELPGDTAATEAPGRATV